MRKRSPNLLQLLFFIFCVFILSATGRLPAQSFWACSRDFLARSPNVSAVTPKYNEYYGKGMSGQPIPHFKDVVYSLDGGSQDGDFDLQNHSCPTRADNCANNDADGTLNSINYDGTLKYDVYYPTISNTSSPPMLPAIFFFHPGGFSDCSYKDLSGIKNMCTEFAWRGFVCFNVEYRRGILQDLSIPMNKTTAQQEMAIYRACQDARGAIRTVFQRQDEGWDNNLYQIDKSQIFLAGMSAGGLIAMNLAYYDPAEVAQVFPTTGNSAAQILGDIDADLYYGSVTIPFQSSIKGVLDMWGGLPLPANTFGNVTSQTSFFSSNSYNPPLIAFAGFHDNVFWLDPTSGLQKVHFSTNSIYNSESTCVPNISAAPYSVDASLSFGLTMGSTLNMYEILQNLNVPSEMYIDCQMKHGLDKPCDLDKDPDCIYQSEFGTGLGSPTAVQVYMVQRACVFFQGCVNGKPNLGTTEFIECENKRVACDQHYTGCSDSQPCPPSQ